MNKKDFFEIYNKVVNYQISLDSLDEETLLKIESILKEDIKLQRKKIYDIIKKKS